VPVSSGWRARVGSADLGCRELAEIGALLDLATGDVGEHAEPAADHGADGGRHLSVGPAGGDHLLEDPDVAGLDVLIEEVACPLPADPQRLRGIEHLALAVQQPRILGIEDGEDELSLRTEVVVDLAERNAGGLGDRSRGQVGVALCQQAAACGGQDRRAGIGGRRVPALGSRRALGRARVHLPSIRPAAHDAT
jgi:hypothetical protein